MVDAKKITNYFCRSCSVGGLLIPEQPVPQGLGRGQDGIIGAEKWAGSSLLGFQGHVVYIVPHFINQEIFFSLIFPWD